MRKLIARALFGSDPIVGHILEVAQHRSEVYSQHALVKYHNTALATAMVNRNEAREAHTTAVANLLSSAKLELD